MGKLLSNTIKGLSIYYIYTYITYILKNSEYQADTSSRMEPNKTGNLNLRRYRFQDGTKETGNFKLREYQNRFRYFAQLAVSSFIGSILEPVSAQVEVSCFFGSILEPVSAWFSEFLSIPQNQASTANSKYHYLEKQEKVRDWARNAH